MILFRSTCSSESVPVPRMIACNPRRATCPLWASSFCSNKRSASLRSAFFFARVIGSPFSSGFFGGSGFFCSLGNDDSFKYILPLASGMADRVLLEELGPVHRGSDHGLFDAFENMLRAATSKMDFQRMKQNRDASPLFTIIYEGISKGISERTYFYNGEPFVEIDSKNKVMNYWSLAPQAPSEFMSVIEYGERAGYEIRHVRGVRGR